MKLIRLFTRYENLNAVREKLFNSGAPGLSVTDAQGIGKPLGQMASEQDGRPTPLPTFKRLVSVEVVCEDAQVGELVDALVEVCRTGSQGDGKIFVHDVTEAIRIRTGERGDDALY
ncbi:MAG: P-II family nitrogen regulator [Nitrospinae bacterium]|nr:P-II family nitrogen regulator [Nitrospinota bacterium]